MSKRPPKAKPLQPHPSLVEFNEQIANAETVVERMESVIDFLTEQRWNVLLPLVKAKLSQLPPRPQETDMDEPQPDYDALEEGHYECPDSPSVRCIYDNSNDPSHDNCLFCGEPSERK